MSSYGNRMDPYSRNMSHRGNGLFQNVQASYCMVWHQPLGHLSDWPMFGYCRYRTYEGDRDLDAKAIRKHHPCVASWYLYYPVMSVEVFLLLYSLMNL